jgi:hypothetical protein
VYRRKRLEINRENRVFLFSVAILIGLLPFFSYAEKPNPNESNVSKKAEIILEKFEKHKDIFAGIKALQEVESIWIYVDEGIWSLDANFPIDIEKLKRAIRVAEKYPERNKKGALQRTLANIYMFIAGFKDYAKARHDNTIRSNESVIPCENSFNRFLEQGDSAAFGEFLGYLFQVIGNLFSFVGNSKDLYSNRYSIRKTSKQINKYSSDILTGD